jgi:hypothetical protein
MTFAIYADQVNRDAIANFASYTLACTAFQNMNQNVSAGQIP